MIASRVLVVGASFVSALFLSASSASAQAWLDERERAAYDQYAEFFPGAEGSWPQVGPNAFDLGIGYAYGASLRNAQLESHAFQGQLGIHFPTLSWLDLALAGTFLRGAVAPDLRDGQIIAGGVRLGVWLFSALTALRHEWSMFNLFLGYELLVGEAIGGGTSNFVVAPAPYVAFQAFVQCHFAIRATARFGWYDLTGTTLYGEFDHPTELQVTLVFFVVRDVRERFPRLERFRNGGGYVCH